MIIDEVLPAFDERVDLHVVVDADPATTFAAIDTADLWKDPVIRVLAGVRDLPNTCLRRLRGEPVERIERYTFRDNEALGWVDLGETPGVERVAGAVGRFWKRDYGWRAVTPGEFRIFDEPGYAKTVAGFSVRPYGEHRTLLSMESRTALTDEAARRRFRRYWLLVGPFARALMARGLRAVKAEAESLAEHAHPVAEMVPAPTVDLTEPEVPTGT